MKSSIKKLTLAASASALLGSMTGCSLLGAVMGFGSTTTPIGATSNPVSVMSKQGEGCYRSLLFGFVPISANHNSVYHSAADGNITKISTIDEQFFTVFGLYNSVCTITHGE